MHTLSHVITLLATATLLGACGGPSRHDAFPQADACQPCPALSAAPSLPVQVLVLTREDGTGNPLWTRGYVEELLDTASAQLGHAVTFSLATYTTVPESYLYALPQGALLSYALTASLPGHLTIVVSRPDTEDTAGHTLQATRPGRRIPYLVMRSRAADWQGIDDTARILLHELGHNAGLFHRPESFLDDGGLHTDNTWTREDGLVFLATYIRVVGGQQ